MTPSQLIILEELNRGTPPTTIAKVAGVSYRTVARMAAKQRGGPAAPAPPKKRVGKPKKPRLLKADLQTTPKILRTAAPTDTIDRAAVITSLTRNISRLDRIARTAYSAGDTKTAITAAYRSGMLTTSILRSAMLAQYMARQGVSVNDGPQALIAAGWTPPPPEGLPMPDTEEEIVNG